MSPIRASMFRGHWHAGHHNSKSLIRASSSPHIPPAIPHTSPAAKCPETRSAPAYERRDPPSTPWLPPRESPHSHSYEIHQAGEPVRGGKGTEVEDGGAYASAAVVTAAETAMSRAVRETTSSLSWDVIERQRTRHTSYVDLF